MAQCLEQISVARGVPPTVARAHARLGLAVTRGLLLDLLATRDSRGVDRAMDAFIDLYDAWLARTKLGCRPQAVSAQAS